ncbi:MAG: HAD family hydrolase [Candidatus Marsarchaeota archaeon]|nr:HAD family hydrolase [Candidatus Marsarchaeota archaeon]
MLVDRYNLFIFDWDGTLSTSTSIVKIARLLKRRYSVAQINKHMDRYNAVDRAPRFKEERTSRVYSLAYGVYSIFYKPRLKPGVVELFRLLKKKGKKIAIFSDSNKFRLAIEVNKLGIMDYADFVLSADSIKRFKPDPTGLIEIMNQFGYKKEKCVYVGDMASDVFAAKFAGLKMCAVADGVDSYELLKVVGADYIARSVGMIKKLR